MNSGRAPYNVKVTFMMRAAEHEALLRLANEEDLDLSAYLRTLVSRANQELESKRRKGGQRGH